MSKSPKQTDQITAIEKLEKYLRQSGRTMETQEARYLVDMYYMSQAYRIRMSSQISAMNRSQEPHAALGWMLGQAEKLEECAQKILGEFAASRAVGAWSQSICGIGPVISAGLLAHIDGAGSNTVSRIWRFAGLDPTAEWYGREEAKKIVAPFDQIDEDTMAVIAAKIQRPAAALRLHAYNFGHREQPAASVDEIGEWMPSKTDLAKALSMRPWNARLKVLCWKIGQSFVKVSGNESDFYGKLYKRRKERDLQYNEEGRYAETSAAILMEKNYGKDTEAFKAYNQGKLPRAHIQARAERYAVKIFLAHWHKVAYFDAHQTLPPKPYVLDILGHGDEIQVPNWPFETVPATVTNG